MPVTRIAQGLTNTCLVCARLSCQGNQQERSERRGVERCSGTLRLGTVFWNVPNASLRPFLAAQVHAGGPVADEKEGSANPALLRFGWLPTQTFAKCMNRSKAGPKGVPAKHDSVTRRQMLGSKA